MNHFWNLLGVGLLVFLSAAGLSLIIWSIPHSELPVFHEDWLAEEKKVKKKVK